MKMQFNIIYGNFKKIRYISQWRKGVKLGS
jgi:hypothetical protein